MNAPDKAAEIKAEKLKPEPLIQVKPANPPIEPPKPVKPIQYDK